MNQPEEPIYISVPQSMRELLPHYLESISSTVGEMCSVHLPKRHLFELSREAHKMKGTGSLYGISRISESAEEIEDAIQDNDWEAVDMALEDLQDFLSRVDVSYDQEEIRAQLSTI